MKFTNRYRIVTDGYAGFEAQYRPWWCPFWVQLGDQLGRSINTNSTIEEAEALINFHKKRLPRKRLDRPAVVKSILVVAVCTALSNCAAHRSGYQVCWRSPGGNGQEHCGQAISHDDAVAGVARSHAEFPVIVAYVKKRGK